MSIIRWDPFDDLASLRESMDKLFEDFFTRRPRGEAVTAWQPAVEMFETDSDIVVRADLPGIDPKHVDITVTDDTLTLKGEAKAEHEDRGRTYVRREDRKSTRLNSSHTVISYAVFCLKKKTNT